MVLTICRHQRGNPSVVGPLLAEPLSLLSRSLCASPLPGLPRSAEGLDAHGRACHEGVQLRIPPVAVYRALCSFASPRAVSRSRAVRLRTVTRRCNLPLQLLPQTSPSPRFSPVGPPLAPSFLTLPSSLLPSAQLLSLPSAFLLSTRVLRASHGSYAPRTLNSRVLQCLFRHLFPSPSFPVPHCPSAPCFGGQCGSTSNSSDHTEEGAVIPPPIAPQL